MPADRRPLDESENHDDRRDAPGTSERPPRESDRQRSETHDDRDRPASPRPPLTERERRERWPLG